jgi:hypothetical protein
MASVRVGLGTLGFCEPKMRFILVLHKTFGRPLPVQPANVIRMRYASGFGSRTLFRAKFVVLLLRVTVKFGNILSVNFTTIHDLYQPLLRNTGQETKLSYVED